MSSGFPETVRVLPSKLNLFNNARINEVVEMGYDEEFHPIGYNKAVHDPIKFFVRGSEHWIDLEKSYIEFDLEFTGTDGETTPKAFKSDDKAGFVNDIGNALFSAVTIKVNDAPVSITTEQYPYVAYLQNLLNYPKDFSENIGRLYLWQKDDSEKMDDITSNANVARKKWVTSKNHLYGVVKLKSPLFLMKHYLMSFLNLDITMDRVTNHDFYIQSGTKGTFSVKVESVVLKMRKLKLLPSFVSGFENFLKNQIHFIEYPLTNSEIITKTYAGLGTQLIEDNLFHGTIPSRIICGFVKNKAYSGDRTTNPFNFQNLNVTEVSLTVNGIAYPRSAISCDFTSKNYVNLYHCFLDSLQSVSTTNTNAVNLSFEEYGDGFTLFSFDMSPDQYGNMNQNIFNTPANVQLKFKFAAGTTDSISMLVYHETVTRMIVNSTRQVQIFSK